MTREEREKALALCERWDALNDVSRDHGAHLFTDDFCAALRAALAEVERLEKERDDYALTLETWPEEEKASEGEAADEEPDLVERLLSAMAENRRLRAALEG